MRGRSLGWAAALVAALAGVFLFTVTRGPEQLPPGTGEAHVRGILIEVQGATLQRAEGFTLRTDDGREMVFTVATEFNAGVPHPMSPGHMRQHMALVEPIVVTYVTREGRLVALSAVDAVEATRGP